MKLLATPILLFMIATAALAQWPVVLNWGGIGPEMPIITPDGHNGVFAAGRRFSFQNDDVFLFHLDSLGHSLWDVSDSACYIAPCDQSPHTLYADGTGGCVMWMEETLWRNPPTNRFYRAQIVRYNAEGHKVWQYMPYDTVYQSPVGDRYIASVAVTHGQVLLFWTTDYWETPHSWLARFRLEDGVPLDTPTVRSTLLFAAGPWERNDTLFVWGQDSMAAYDLLTGNFAALEGHVACPRFPSGASLTP